MGKQKTKTKTSSTTAPWSEQAGYLKDTFSQAQNNFRNSQPNADMQAAWQRTRDSINDPNSGYGRAMKYYGGILDSGGYDPNVFANISSPIIAGINSQFMGSGRTGGGLQGIDLAKEITQAYSPFAVQQMNMAANAMPSLEGQGTNALSAVGRQQYDLPNEALRNYYGIVGSGNWGGTTNATSKSTTSGGTLGQIAGAGIGLLGSAMSGGMLGGLGGMFGASPATIWNPTMAGGVYSDRRLKEDVSRVGALDDGTPVYAYRYKAGGPVHIGVMAQEVEAKYPETVSADAAGYKMVDYGKLASMVGR